MTKKIDTYAPLFSGFYESVWLNSDTESQYIEYINEQREEKRLEPINFDALEIDYEKYKNDTAKAYCSALVDKLKDFVKSIEFKNLWSPKEYNFSTDRIDCFIVPRIKAIREYIYDNKGDFIQYLHDNYTSYNGFMSFHSNQFDVWEKDTKKFTDLNDKDGHKLGSILSFIYRTDEVNDDIHEELENNGHSICGYITNYDALINPVPHKETVT